MESKQSQSNYASPVCAFCQHVSEELSTDHSTWREGEYQVNKLGTTFLNLLGNASSCQLCQLIISSDGDWLMDGSRTSGMVGSLKSYFTSLPEYYLMPDISPIEICLRPDELRNSGFNLRLPVGNTNLMDLRLNITADKGDVTILLFDADNLICQHREQSWSLGLYKHLNNC